jgi:hypothetical protein
LYHLQIWPSSCSLLRPAGSYVAVPEQRAVALALARLVVLSDCDDALCQLALPLLAEPLAAAPAVAPAAPLLATLSWALACIAGVARLA